MSLVRVLVLEDDDATRTRICRALEASVLGFQVVWSGATAETALAWLAEMHSVVDEARGLPGGRQEGASSAAGRAGR